MNSFIENKLLNEVKPKILTIVLLFGLWLLLYLNLETITNLLIFSLIGLTPKTHLTDAVWFFVFEVPKVLLLLVLIVFGVGIIRSYFSPERTRKMLGGKKLFAGNVMASLLGIVTPFCSCSAIPLFLGFVESGVPLGVTFSFLIAAPMINEVALVLLFGLFGWKTALLYMFDLMLKLQKIFWESVLAPNIFTESSFPLQDLIIQKALTLQLLFI